MFFLPLIPLIAIIIGALAGFLPALAEASASITQSMFKATKGEGTAEDRGRAAVAGIGLVGGGAIGAIGGGPLGAFIGALLGMFLAVVVFDVTFNATVWVMKNLVNPAGKAISDALETAEVTGKNISKDVQTWLDGIFKPEDVESIEAIEAGENPLVVAAKKWLKESAKSFIEEKKEQISAIKTFFENVGKIWEKWNEIVDEIKLNMGLAIIEAVKNLVNAVIAIYNDVASKLKAFTIVFPPILAGGKATVWNPFDFLELIDIQNVPTAQTGGTIEKTGIAKVHKGETIVPAGGGGINYSPTFNISPDVDGNALKRMLEEHDRNLLSRLSRGSTLRGRFLNV